MANRNTLNAQVTNILKSYAKNGPAMLAIMVHTLDHFVEHGDNTQMLRIAKATEENADFSTYAAIVSSLTDGTVKVKSTDKGIKITKSKDGARYQDAHMTLARAAVAKGNVTFRSKAFLKSIGLQAGETKAFSLEGAASSLAKRAMANDVQLEQLLKAVTKAYREQTGEVAKVEAPKPTTSALAG